jgi:hypothetical protein
MANRDAPRGFWPVRHMHGGVIRANEYQIASGLSSSIYTGDPVKTSPGTNKRIDVGAAGNAFVGVFAGVQYMNAQGEVIFSRYWPGSTVLATGSIARAFVYDDPDILFGIQFDGNFTATMVGQLVDINFDQTGVAATGVSGCEADSGSVAGSGEPLRIVELLSNIGNAYGNFADIGVLINTHELLTRGAVAT